MRATRDDLNMRLDAIGVEPGETWQHLSSGVSYFVVTTALNESDHTPLVVYQPSDGEGPVWTRPASEFIKRFRLR